MAEVGLARGRFFSSSSIGSRFANVSRVGRRVFRGWAVWASSHGATRGTTERWLRRVGVRQQRAAASDPCGLLVCVLRSAFDRPWRALQEVV